MITAKNSLQRVSIASLADVQATNIAAEINAGAGVSSSSANKTIEIYDQLDTTNVVVLGRNAIDTADVLNTAYLFGKDYSQTTGKPETYDDGFNGKLIQKSIDNLNGGRGAHIKRITFIGTRLDTGVQDASVLQAAALAIVSYTSIGGVTKAEPINIGKAIRNTQNLSGTLTLDVDIWLNSVSQIKISAKAGSSISMNIEWGF